MPHFASDCAYFFVEEYFHDDSFRKCFEHLSETPLLPRQPCHEVRIQRLPGKFRLPCLVPLRLHGMQRSLQCNRRVLHAHGHAWSHVCCRRAWRKHREVPYTRSLVVPQPEYRCRTGLVCIGLVAPKAATMVTMPTQRAIGSGPSKGICSQNESLDTEDSRSHHPSIWAGEIIRELRKVLEDRSVSLHREIT